MGKKITLTFEDTPAMRTVLRQLAESAVDAAESNNGWSRSYKAFDDAVTHAIDDEEPGALVVPMPTRRD